MSRQIWFSARCKPITSIDILATKNEVAEMLLWCGIINKLKVMKNAVERSCISKAYEQSGEPEYRSTLNCVSLYAAFFLLFLSTSSTYRLFPWLAQAERLYRFLSEGLGHIHGSACFLDSWNFFFLIYFMPYRHFHSPAVCGTQLPKEAFQNWRKEARGQAMLLATVSRSSLQCRKKYFWFLTGYEIKTHGLILLWLAFLKDLRILALKEAGMICVVEKLCEQLCGRKEI